MKTPAELTTEVLLELIQSCDASEKRCIKLAAFKGNTKRQAAAWLAKSAESRAEAHGYRVELARRATEAGGVLITWGAGSIEAAIDEAEAK
jgi:hypothetical protein